MKSNRFLFFVFVIGIIFTCLGIAFIRIEITSDATGVVQYKNETVIYSPQQSRVSQVLTEPNQRVAKGDILVVLKDADLDLEVNNLKQKILQAKHELELAKLIEKEHKITGALPELQDIDAVLALQKEYSRLSSLLEKNNDISLEKKLISKKQYYTDGLTKTRDEMALLDTQKLLRWRNAGLEEVKSQQSLVQSGFLANSVSILEDRLSILLEEQNKLTIRAPYDGVVLETYFHFTDELMARGDAVIKVADDNSGYQVKAFVPEKNIDLIRRGMKVKMESLVFQSQLEGYLYGEVSQIVSGRNVFNPQDTQQALFEVIADIKDYPHPPIPGSRVDIEIIVGRGNIISALLNRPAGSRG